LMIQKRLVDLHSGTPARAVRILTLKLHRPQISEGRMSMRHGVEE
jgi:hypothetical protein